MTIAEMLDEGTIEQVGSFNRLSFPQVKLGDIVELTLPGNDDLALMVAEVEVAKSGHVAHYRVAELDDTADLNLAEIAEHAADRASLELVGSTSDAEGKSMQFDSFRCGQRAVFWAAKTGHETQKRITEPVDDINVYRRRTD